MKSSEHLKTFVEELETEAEAVSRAVTGHDYWETPILDVRTLHAFLTKCQLLVVQLGPLGEQWKARFEAQEKEVFENFQKARGALSAIADMLKKGRLVRLEEMCIVEVLGDLVEHADILYSNNHYLACCVVLRAVLEERLRKLCDAWGCLPQKAKPSIDDYNQALYALGKTSTSVGYDNAAMLWVTSIAAIGNDAAHALRSIEKGDAERMLRDVQTFLAKFSVS
jgi:Domain of unknown function (DUF4145)